MAVLSALSGLFSLISGALSIGATSGGIFPILGVLVGVVQIGIGFFQLLVTWGLWTGRSWACFIAMIFTILGEILGLLDLLGGSISSAISLLLSAMIIYYLYTKPVRAFFC